MEKINFNIGKQIKSIGLIFFLVASVLLGLVALRQRIVKPKATAGVPNLSFSVSPNPLNPGSDFDLTVKVEPNGTTFNAFELHFSFDDTKVGLRNPANPTSNFGKLFSSDLGLTQTVTGNKIVISGAKTGASFSGNQSIDLVNVKMKVLAGATETAKFIWDNATEIEGKTLAKTDGDFTIGSVGGGAKLYFTTDKSSYEKGENLNLALVLDTGGAQVNSVQFEFNYDDTAVTFQDATGDLLGNIDLDASSGFDINNPLNTIDPQKKMVRVGLVTNSSVTGNRQLAVIRLKIKEDTTQNIFSFTPGINSKVYNLQTQNILSDKPIYSLTIGSNSTISPTPTGTVAADVALSFSPSTQEFKIGEAKIFELTAAFSSGSSSEKLDYFKTEISFSPTYLSIPEGQYIDTSTSGFGKIFRVDGPTVANQTGKIVIELGAVTPGSGPSTDKPLTIAKIYFKGITKTPSPQNLTLVTAQIVNNLSKKLTVGTRNATYTVVEGSQGSLIDIGDKESLTLKIKGGTGKDPQVKFFVKFLAEQTPEIKARLKVVDLVSQMTPVPPPDDSCQQPGNGQYYFKDIPMVLFGDSQGYKIYQPKAGGTFKHDGATVTISSDGWVPLPKVVSGRSYSLSVKGEKHRDTKMVDAVTLVAGNPESQDFDWSENQLEVGDLANPNNNYQQDCTVNSVDVSLMISRLGKTDDDSLKVADVNYDGVVNGNDISQIDKTMWTKPDDDL